MRFRLIVVCAIIALMNILPAHAAAKEEVVFWYGATQDEQAAYEQMIAEFNRTHADILVRGMLVPQRYVERKLMLSVSGGAPPDVVRFYTHLGGEMMSRGGLEPLSGLVARDKFDLSDFYPVGIEQNTYKGRLYGIPWILSPNALFYNKALFRKAGLDPNHPPKTWKELEEYAMKLTVRDKNGNVEQVGYANFLNNPADFHMYLWQSGGNPLSADLKHPNFTSPEGIGVLTWMQDFLIKEMGTMKPGISHAQASADAVRKLQTFNSSFVGATQDPFGLGKVAMRVDSPFRIPALLKYFPNLDIGVAAAPYSKVRAVEVVGNSLVIPKGSRHKEAAWEFIKFASTRKQSLGICKVAGRIPARISAATWPEFYNNPLVKPFVDQIKYGRTTPVAPGYREVSDALAGSIEMALKGQQTPKAALDNAAEKGSKILYEANEDPNLHPKIPWKATAIISGLVLLLAIAAVCCYTARETRHSRAARREAMNFYLFLSPWLIGFIVLTFGSIAASLVFSFSKWDTLSPARFIGLDNFINLFTNDPRFMKALGNTLYYAAFSIPLAMIGGLAISVLMNQKLRGISIFRTIYYLPAVVSGVATAILWQWIFNPGTGILNKLLALVMKTPPGWLIDPDWSKPAFIIMGLWAIGGTMIIYLAGLQGIPGELYEASRIDGASAWQRFRNVTLPLLTPTIFYQLIVGTMAAFQFFLPAYIMTDGGPQDSTLFYSLYLFRNGFEWMKIGYASAMAWVLLAIVMVITIIQFKFANRWVYYEGEKES
ncbi:MAG: extracellular solute-binding protein [Armatimonadota bacterium]